MTKFENEPKVRWNEVRRRGRRRYRIDRTINGEKILSDQGILFDLPFGQWRHVDERTFPDIRCMMSSKELVMRHFQYLQTFKR